MSADVIAQRVLWFLPVLLHVGAAAMIFRRKLLRELPLFFSYLIFKVALTGVLWSFRQQMPHYFYIYWIGEAILIVLGFAVIYEIFTNVVGRYETIHQLSFLLYRWTAVCLLILAAITAATASGMDSARIIEGILILERGARIVQAGLLLLLFVFASYLGLSWRSNVFGIALGFGLFASVELVLVAIRAQAGTSANEMYVWLKPLAYNFTSLIWAIYLLQPQTAPQTVSSLPKTEMAVWDRALMEYLRR
jgi:putative Mn2+ efflux pump MntP